MNIQDVANFEAYKETDLDALADATVLLYKISNLIQDIDLSTNLDLVTKLTLIDDNISAFSLLLDNIYDYLDTVLQPSIGDCKTSLLQLDSILTTCNTLHTAVTTFTQLYQSTYHPVLIDSLDVLATLQQQQVDALQALQTEVLNTLPTLPTAAQLSLLNQRATTMEALLLDVKNLLNNSRLLSTNSYPLLKLFTVPTYPAVLAIRLPSDTTSYSISLISLPSLPDTLNSYAVYDLALESTPAPPAEPPCPCLSTALPIEQWYPLFWGTEETQDNLALPDSLVLRITVTGASQNAQLALKLWSRTVPQVQSSVGTING